MVRVIAIALASQLPSAYSHGFIEQPLSRQQQACEEVYNTKWDGYNTDPTSQFYYCVTARETICWGGAAPPLGCGQGVIPGQELTGQGYPIGTVPGTAILNEPFCSAGGANTHINQAAVDAINKRGSATAQWTEGQTVNVKWNVQAAHGGRYAYFLCCDGSDSWNCFSKNPLKDASGKVWMDVDWVGGSVPVKSDTLTLPTGAHGECTMAWRWDGGCDDKTLSCPVGQPSESSGFASCSDVTIAAKATQV